MEAQILSFRRGRKTQHTNQFIIAIPGIRTREKAQAMISKKVVWKSPAGKEITGTISALHGNIGKLRVQFEKGLPGQAVSTKVKVE